MATLLTLHDNHLWTLGCRVARILFSISQDKALGSDPFLAQQMALAAQRLPTLIAEMHSADTHETRGFSHLYLCGCISEIQHFIAVAERIGLGTMDAIDDAQRLSEELLHTYQHQISLEKSA